MARSSRAAMHGHRSRRDCADVAGGTQAEPFVDGDHVAEASRSTTVNGQKSFELVCQWNWYQRTDDGGAL